MMMLVLSLNPCFDHDAEAVPPVHQPVWESKQRNPNHATPENGKLSVEPPSRKTAYCKRKYTEGTDPLLNFRNRGHTMSPVEPLDEHSRVLHLSLDKMRFTDDPEAFLRRSVLINNLLRRLRNEILFHRAWLPMPSPVPVSLAMPVFTYPDRGCKRLRFLQDGKDECPYNCCCFYEASRYLRFPVCVHEQRIEPSSSSSLDLNELEQRVDEKTGEEDEHNSDEDLDSLCPGLDLCEATLQAKQQPIPCHKRRTRCKLAMKPNINGC